MIGKIISHYKILEKLGSGGMGDVYKAEDTRLKRPVALKFLSPQLTRDSEATERFIYEAQAASALDHQNICTIHEIDRGDDGQMFICMAYYEGETLKQKIARGAMPIEQAINIAFQIAQGLSRAHEKGIIHRDIKPANIIVQPDGTIKIIDFGLAKLLSAKGITKNGTTMGTVAYMSYEQARGKATDHRTDIWSLGVVLYEMITGQLPFKGEVEQTVIYSILNEEPEPMKRLRPEVPRELERIVNKAMTKNLNERYESTKELFADLQRAQREDTAVEPSLRPSSFLAKQKHLFLTWYWIIGLIVLITISTGILIRLFVPAEKEIMSTKKMLAVLPFENLGPSENEYFADGITDEIITRLAVIQEIGVIARTSSIQYKNIQKSIPEIGKELGVDYILEGTVRWQKTSEGSTLIRVTPQLIMVSDATHIWAEIYEKDMTDIFQLQSNIAKQVVAALDIALLQREQQAMEEKITDNLGAYNYYLRGNYYIRRSNTREDTRIAIDMYQQAIRLDNDFASAYARLSYAHLKMYHWGFDPDHERRTWAKQALDKAFQLKPKLAEAQLALGYYYYWGYRELDKALEQFAAARKQQPNNSELIAALGYVKRRQGKWKQSIENMKRAYNLDPLSSRKAMNLGHIYLITRNYTEAESYFDRAISLAPDIAQWYLFKALFYLCWNGSLEKIQEVLSEGLKQSEPANLLRSMVIDDWYVLARISPPEIKKKITLIFLRSVGNDTVSFYYLTKAIVYGQMKRFNLEQAYFDSARVVFETRVEDEPDNAFFHIILGYAYAGLGFKNEAIQEGKKSIELLPISRDAINSTSYVRMLAEIYVMVGEYEAAIDQLEYLLSVPSLLSPAWLRADPIWQPLSEHPRFRELLKNK